MSIPIIIAQSHTSEYLLHKYWARKPHNVISRFIEELVPEGGLVVDPFCGSGVVLHEAQKLNRNAIGFDVNPISILISKVLVNPPDINEFKVTVERILKETNEKITDYYSVNGDRIKYCVHQIVTTCPNCGQKQSLATIIKKGRKYLCPNCETQIRFNLENLKDTNIVGVSINGKKELLDTESIIKTQQELSNTNVLSSDNAPYSFNFVENRRILSYSGLKTDDLFTPRNFSILVYLANQFNKINDERVRDAAKLMLSASVAQCSRLIPMRNNLSTGGPAWSVPGFWCPPEHLETNPLVHIEARFSKFIKGITELSKNKNNPSIQVLRSDACSGLENLIHSNQKADLIFFDPPYGDSIPYVEFSAIWNSFLKDFPNPNVDISVSDRKGKIDSWNEYNDNLINVVKCISTCLSVSGKLLITFNNNDMRAWSALINALQKSNMKCLDVTYQIPAVVSSKAQFSINGSYISDIYSIYEYDNSSIVTYSLTPVTDNLIKCARYRGGKLSYGLTQRIIMVTWLKENIAVSLLPEKDTIIESLFEKSDSYLTLKGLEKEVRSQFEEDVINIAKETLSQGPCNWLTLYEIISKKIAEFGIPDQHEIKEVLTPFIIFKENRCISFINNNSKEYPEMKQSSLTDWT